MLSGKKLYHECPRYQTCNVNKCPLHESYPNLLYADDREKSCTMEKQVRFRIGSQYPEVLKYQGLTVKEWTGKARFDSLSEPDKELIRVRAKTLFCSAFGNYLSAEGVEVGE